MNLINKDLAIRIKRFAGTMVTLVFVLSMFGQDNVFVYGSMKDLSTARKIPNGMVVVYKNGGKLTEIAANGSGKFEVNLDYSAEYKLQWEAPGYVGKNITIDTRNVPEEDRMGGHGMNVDITLLGELPGVDFSILEQPFGKAKYTASEANFMWDMDYTEQMKSAQAKLIKDYEDRLKNAEKLEEDFKKLVEQGDQNMTAKNYGKAVDNFQKALEIKPKDPIATAKLSDAQMQYEGQNAEAEMQKKYDDLVKEADGLFGKGEYEQAKGKYQEALTFKEEEAYPKQKMKECDAKIAELAKKAEEERLAKELQEKYDAAIKAADEALKGEQLDNAESKYNEAIKLKPQEQYPKDKLLEIKAKRADLASKAEEERKAKELQAKYDAAIAAADASFSSEQYEQAKVKYNEALSIKADEKYPKDQLAAIDIKLKELADKEEQDRLARELQAKYDAAIVAADASFKAEQYDQARVKYEEAIGLKEEERYPKDQLKAIEAKLEEIAKAEEEAERLRQVDEAYRAAIAEADAAFKTDDFDLARSGYEKASGIKPDESYPKDQIKAIADRLAEIAAAEEEERKRKELQEQYDNVIAKADKAFDKASYEEAKSAYQAAQQLKADETYPGTRLKEIEAILDRLAAEEEERRKQEEINARYQAKITSADQAYDGEDFETALMDYQDALGIKPNESYPQNRIRDIKSKMDEVAQAQAEADRLKREQEEFEQRYRDLVASGDQAFNATRYSEAKIAFQDASELKPDEQYPKDKLAEINDLIAESERLAAEEAARQSEQLAQAELDKKYQAFIDDADNSFRAKDWENARANYNSALGVKPTEQYPKDQLSAIDDRIAEEAMLAAERDAQQSEEARLAQIQQDYLNLIAEGDNAFRVEDFDRAREKYTSAISVKPEEKYPKDKLAEIEQLLADRAARASEEDRLAEERRRAEEERLRRESEEAEAARLAAEAEKNRLMADKERRERYDAVILSADLAFGETDYDEAKSLYAQAMDLMPGEVYPQSRLEQIDKLLAELERKRAEAEAARLAALEAERQKDEAQVITPRRSGEDDAERFMREAREREEAEKYERIKKLKLSVSENQNDWGGTAEERINGERRRGEALAGAGVGLYSGSEQGRLDRIAELERQKAALRAAEQERIERAEISSEMANEIKRNTEQAIAQRNSDWTNDHTDRVDRSLNEKATIREQEEQRANSARARSEEQARSIETYSLHRESMRQKGNEMANDAQRRVDAEKQAYRSGESLRSNTSRTARETERERLANTPLNASKRFSDYNQSQLAAQYPQGVTEESYSEGNKVIIRRVVVQQNKADEYSKVIAKWGTFYFKNGQSISETIWLNDTGQ